MTLIGKKYLCDRCGESAFGEYTGSVSLYNALHDNFNKPDGWITTDDRDLCPKCAAKYNSIMRDFFSCK